MAITIKDIAKECDVSITAVSFVLNGKDDLVSEKTKEKILNTCKKYNYKPNYLASALKSKTTNTIGVLIPDLENGYYTRILKGLDLLLKEKGYFLIISESGYDFNQFKDAIVDMIDKSIDYLVIVPPSKFGKIKKETIADVLKAIDIPYCILDRQLDVEQKNAVINNDIKGGYIATKYLLDNGHRKIACISGPSDVSSSIDRLEGYKLALKEYNIAFDDSLVFESNYRFEETLGIAEDIIINKKIRSIFAFNDLMAYAVYKVANKYKLNIGEDISLVGYDDNKFSSLIAPGLTSVKQDIDKLCEEVVNSLFNNNESTSVIMVEPTLSIKGSVKTC